MKIKATIEIDVPLSEYSAESYVREEVYQNILMAAEKWHIHARFQLLTVGEQGMASLRLNWADALKDATATITEIK